MSIRVYTLAKELGLTSKELIARLKELKVEAKSHSSTLKDETAELVREGLRAAKQEKAAPTKKKKAAPAKKKKVAPVKKKKKAAPPPLKEVKINVPISVKELAVKLGVKSSELILRLMKEKIMVNINRSLDEDTARLAAEKFGCTIGILPTEEELLIQSHQKKDRKDQLVPRAPIVTMMGHVDHGKTALLDVIRRSDVAAKETGGITQHIGAYEVKVDKGKITFLDTPGHEAFTAMRARGADFTDIVVLVVAVDDGIMPQTIEAIDHARAAKVSLVVAINKIDLHSADIERVKRQLAELKLTPEDWGGKTITVNVSAKTGEGIKQLLEMVLLETEMLELKGNPERVASGAVIEARLSRGSGPVATVLVRNGTLKTGEVILAGTYYGRIRALMNDRGERVKEAGPSTPVEVLGLNGVPLAGEPFYTVQDEKKAREIALQRTQKLRLKERTAVKRITLEDLHRRIEEGEIKELNLIIKADVQGSVEALIDSLNKLGTEEVGIKIMHSGVGAINESDIMLAAVSNAVVIGFHVQPDTAASARTEKEGVDVRLYRVIYEAISDVRSALEGMLEPELKEMSVGTARVKQVFKVSGIGTAAGCMVTKGKVMRGCSCRVVRSGEVVFEGRITSLKRFKNDARQVEEGFECGISMAGLKDIQLDDVLECFEIEKIERKLER